MAHSNACYRWFWLGTIQTHSGLCSIFARVVAAREGPPRIRVVVVPKEGLRLGHEPMSPFVGDVVEENGVFRLEFGVAEGVIKLAHGWELLDVEVSD